ncbi:MAG: acyl carrier protein [Candidatus Dactylopiibacterium carminicum]|uniref:Acyl carrier protein n=1 Tax=Candidatus Dactylopiibacterium carminicum TaxID=857335 RepID=A0A272EY90_9RHOO|nr:phosphopantetheine-binding protein [Candidatus Dactylopiibacterium carminicum]KAF7600466.1 acyl carrier protein [Candidatus Dactylopiibacterium carminicum]PAS95087.1 MAG: acyl carrier protein [Candidatus Dactylopiibacterium carminicum]PAT00464.1 MAG: acyl carrier protein [Candidatus Dactylopiibacterium carminicum]
MTQAFSEKLKTLILTTCDKDEPAGGLALDEILFGPESRLGLDSLDALQISVAIHKQLGVRIADSKETRRAMASLATLEAYLQTRAA